MPSPAPNPSQTQNWVRRASTPRGQAPVRGLRLWAPARESPRAGAKEEGWMRGGVARYSESARRASTMLSAWVLRSA